MLAIHDLRQHMLVGGDERPVADREARAGEAELRVAHALECPDSDDRRLDPRYGPRILCARGAAERARAGGERENQLTATAVLKRFTYHGSASRSPLASVCVGRYSSSSRASVMSARECRTSPARKGRCSGAIPVMGSASAISAKSALSEVL